MTSDVLQWEHLPFPKSLRDFQRLFPDDDACAKRLEHAKWPKGFECPYCHERGEPFRMATRKMVLTCRKCRKQTSLMVGTVMARTHSPLTTPIARYLDDNYSNNHLDNLEWGTRRDNRLDAVRNGKQSAGSVWAKKVSAKLKGRSRPPEVMARIFAARQRNTLERGGVWGGRNWL